MTDIRTQQVIQELAGRLAAIERKFTTSTAIGTGVSTIHGALSVRTTQLGFAAELTSAWSSITGYSWKRLELDGLTIDDPAVQPTGDKAVTVDNDTSLVSGTRVWLEPVPTATGYVITNTTSGSSMLDCSSFASLEPTSCIQLTVRGTPAGRCVDVDPDQSILLTDDDEDGVWEGETQFSTDTDDWDVLYDWPAGDCCPRLRFTNGVDTVTLRYAGCDAGKLLFIGSGADLCGASVDDSPCAENSFIVELECVLCPNPDYAGPGWYCVAETGCTGARSCLQYATDPGAGVIICSGPHADEATCIAACTSTTATPCVGGSSFPATLFVRWPDDFIYNGADSNYQFCDASVASLAGTYTEITYNSGTGYWEGSASPGGCDPIDFELRPTCLSGTVISWRLKMSGGIESPDPSGDIFTALSTSPLHLRGPAGGNLISPGSCCSALYGDSAIDRRFQVFE